MPRVGRHPLKVKNLEETPIVHQKVTITTIVYIPMLAGYWQDSLEVLRLFFESIHANTDQPFDLMVFDNGSCEEVCGYLRELKQAGKIQYLVFSQQNLKKLGALVFLLASAPGDFVVYADSDAYFLPGWLAETLKVFTAFPEVGKVTATPVVLKDATKFPAYEIAMKDPTVQVQAGVLIPEIYANAFRMGLGVSEEEYAERTRNRNDVMLARDGCEIFLSSSDFQFTITRKAIESFMPIRFEKPRRFFDPIYSAHLEPHLEKAGFWQVSTSGYYVHHMGNHVPDFKSELAWLPQEMFSEIGRSHQNNKQDDSRFLRRVLQNRYLRKMLTKLHLWSYRVLYE